MEKLTKKEIKILERRAIRRYKQELREKVETVIAFTVIETLAVASIVYYFIH